MAGPANELAQAYANLGVEPFHELHLNPRTFLFQPTEAWLERQAQKLNRKLQKTDPTHRWHIVHRYDPGDTDKSWGFFKKRQVGTLEVRKSLDATKGSVVLYEVDDRTLASPGFITSSENKHGIFLAMKFEDKVDRFIQMCAERVFPRRGERYVNRPLTDEEIKEIGVELKNSIMVDLFNEQAAARRSQVWGTQTMVKSQLPKLNYLIDRTMGYAISFEQMQDSSVSLDLMYGFIADLRYMARSARSFWDHLFLPLGHFKRSRIVSAEMLEGADKITRRIFGPRERWWEEMGLTFKNRDMFMQRRPTSKNGLARKQADLAILNLEHELNKASPGVESFAAAQNFAGLTYDPELLTSADRVTSAEEYDQMLAKEQNADQRRQATEQTMQDQRKELLVPMCQLVAQKVAEAKAQSIPTPSNQ